MPKRPRGASSREVGGHLTDLSLPRIYALLRARFGHAGWWPGETPFEVCVGAILVQNTAWRNAERALGALRQRGLLRFSALRGVPVRRLERLIRPSGYFRVKARRLRAFLQFLGASYGGRVEAMRREGAGRLRSKLLEVSGIGRETADSIVLYAAGLPLFVVDAYTRRVFARLGLVRGDETYDVIQRFFMERLPRRTALYNDFHAQIVTLGKDVCRPQPRCEVCPLDGVCPRRGCGALARARLKPGDGGVPVSTGTTTPRDAGRACLPARKSGGKP